MRLIVKGPRYLDSERVSKSAIIATLPRSGSWLLAEGMEDTGLCGTPREYFREDYEGIYRRAWNVPADASYRDYVSAVIAAGTTPNGTFGVKLHWGQFARLLERCRPNAVDADSTASELIASIFPNCRYVYLTRRNKARQAISLYRAISLDVWWAFDDAGATEPQDRGSIGKPDLEAIASLEENLVRDDMRWMEFFEASRLRPLLLTFEDFTSSYQRAVRDVVSYVHDVDSAGVPVPPPRLRRQADATSEAWLEEYLATSSHAVRSQAMRQQYLDRLHSFAAQGRRQ